MVINPTKTYFFGEDFVGSFWFCRESSRQNMKRGHIDIEWIIGTDDQAKLLAFHFLSLSHHPNGALVFHVNWRIFFLNLLL